MINERNVVLAPDRNIWRLERAERVAVLIDAARYFGALRETLLKAQSSVFIIGWDLDSRTRLVDETAPPRDPYPETFVHFLTALVRERPQLFVHLLVWDYSMLYALEREPFPFVSLGLRTPPRIRLCFDDNLPAGASHHQKLVVVDDAVAFCGGLDITIRRWDTTEHRPNEPRRIDPTGASYLPFHDLQAIVDGKAALALARLVRDRWATAACTAASAPNPIGDPWPVSVCPEFTGIDVGIARTSAATEHGHEIREIEALFVDAIDCATRAIYIENQFLTATRIAERLARRLREQPALEVVIVVPNAHHSWLEAQAMRTGRNRFMQILETAGVASRVAVLCPHVSDGETHVAVMVHSKIMIVDDVLLHIGSANLNNRSIGLDSECDLAIEAQTADQRRTVRHTRDRLLGHHCGVAAEDVAASLARTGSLIKTALALSRNGHCLRPVEKGVEATFASTIEFIADPERPFPPPAFLEDIVGKPPQTAALRRLAKIVGVGIVAAGFALAWSFTPLSAVAYPDFIRHWFSTIADVPGASLIVLAVFVLGGLVAFPVLLLIAATAAAFGPWLGFAYAALGALASAIVTYAIGAAIGRDALETVLGPRLDRVRRSIVERGLFAVAAVRLVPVAPFTLVNLVAGASNVRFADYMLGTMIGMAPGMMMMCALGYQIWSILMNPTLTNMIFFLVAIGAWLSLSLGAQALILRWRRGGA